MENNHKSYEHIPKGIKIKRLDFMAEASEEGKYLHSDDYYVFGFIESGSCEIQVDFKFVKAESGEVIIISPNQLHRIISFGDAKGYAMLIDCSLISERQLKSLVSYTREKNILKAPLHVADTLNNLFSILYNINLSYIELSNPFRHYIGQAIIELTCNVLEKTRPRKYDDRFSRLTVSFFTLLSTEITHNRRPSYYAQRLNISTVYLNEAVKKVTGKSVSSNINEEIILRAKRLLTFSKMEIKEIAFKLGFDDAAYFTRLFTKKAGCSPLQFRKNLK